MSSKREQVSPREAALWIAERLCEHGHVAYFAGGCVRDRLLGIEPSDFDVATDARPDRIQELFHSAVGVGESFGVMLVRRGGHAIEVATFRSDGPYQDGRHPVSVTFSDARSDAARRDFTVNAIFEDPSTGELVDHFNGREDLDNGILRAVGDAPSRMAEDHLRALRAVRFAARFSFEIEAATAEAIRDSVGDLDGVSRERIGGEIRRMLAHPSRVRAAALLESFGLDAPVLLESSLDSAAHPVLAVLGERERPPIDGVAAWLIDRHGSEANDHVEAIRDALLLSNQEHRTLEGVLSTEQALREDWISFGVAARKRLAALDVFPVALELLGARDSGLHDRVIEDLEPLRATGLAPDPMLDGNDLITIGLKPGPDFKSILDAVYDAQLEGRVVDRKTAVELARELATRG